MVVEVLYESGYFLRTLHTKHVTIRVVSFQVEKQRDQLAAHHGLSKTEDQVADSDEVHYLYSYFFSFC